MQEHWIMCSLMLFFAILAPAAGESQQEVDVDGPIYRSVLSDEQRSRLVTTQRYVAQDFALTSHESFEKDWILYNPHQYDDIRVVDSAGGESMFSMGMAEPVAYVLQWLRFPWSHGVVGTTHVVSLRFKSDFRHGNKPNGYAGFMVRGRRTRSGVDISHFFTEDQRAHVRVLMNREGRNCSHIVTEQVEDSLGKAWRQNELHTYTLKWTSTDSGAVPFALYIDGRHVLDYVGQGGPENADPGMDIQFVYGKGSVQITAAEWVQVPPVGSPRGRVGVQAFRGVGFNRMRFAEIEQLIGAKNVSIMDMRMVRVYLTPSGGSGETLNVPRPAHVPSDFELGATEGFLLMDAPASILGQRLTHAIENRVRGGANVLALGGNQAFGRGGYAGSELEELLPVKSEDTVWDTVHLGQPTVLELIKDDKALDAVDWDELPTVEFLHCTSVKDGAEVVLSAGGHHVLTRRRLGAGYIYAWTALPWGPAEDGFWNWSQWPKLCAALLNCREGDSPAMRGRGPVDSGVAVGVAVIGP